MTPPSHDDALTVESCVAIDKLRDLVKSRCLDRVVCSDHSAIPLRAMARMIALNLKSASDYIARIEADRNGSELGYLIDGIAFGYTDFTRDLHQLRRLSELMVESRFKQAPIVKVWSAACSTGEELYALAMLTRELAAISNTSDFRFRFLGTDVNGTALNRALSGCFPASEVERLPESFQRYFQQFLRAEPTKSPLMKIDVDFQRMAMWRQLDLLTSDWQLPHKFDVILCRNVLTYFTPEQQQSVIERLINQLAPGGFIVFGACEQLKVDRSVLTPVDDSIYCSTVQNLEGREGKQSRAEFFSNPKWDTLQRMSYSF